jgi:hypothetical protein
MITRVIYFAVALALGLFILIKTYTWVSWTGKSSWAETKIGAGGTYTMWKAAAVAIIIFGYLILIGVVKLSPDHKEKSTDQQNVQSQPVVQ